jgi:hypothetical protein
MELLTKHLRKGFEVVARNLNCLLWMMKVVICQLIMKIPVATPTNAALIALTFLNIPVRETVNRFKSAHEIAVDSANKDKPE